MASTTNRYSYVIDGDAGALVRASAQGDAAVRKLGGGVQYTRQQMQNLSFQMTDIAVSLGSGQSPLTVLLQQGGQLKDAFGGVGGAARALAVGVAGMINPVTLAGAAIAAVATAAVQGYQESERLKDALLLTGNAAGLTEDSFRSLAERISAATSSTVGNAKELATELAASGRVGSQAFESTAQAAALVQQATGKSAEEVAKDFSKMSDDAAKWAAEHNKSWHFIDQDLYRYIKRLQESGQEQQAMIEVNKAVIRAFGDQQKNLGYLESAWQSLGKMASSAWNAMLGAGRTETAGDKLADAQTQLQERLARGPTNELVRANWEKGNERLRQQIESMRELVRLENQQAQAQARIAAKNDFEPDKKPKKERTGYQEKDPLGAFITDQLNAQSDRDAREAERTDQFFQQQDEAYRDRLNRRQATADAFGGAMLDQAQELGIGLIRDERQRGEALIEVERSTQQARIDAWKDSGVDITLAQIGLNETIKAKQLELNEQLKPEWMRMVDSWGDTTKLMQDAYDHTMGNILQTGEDAWVQLATTGKLNVKDMVNSILADMLRLQFRQFVGGLGSSFLDSIGSAIFGSGGAGSSPSGGSGFKLPAFNIPGFAAGGSHLGGVRIVGEDGPELEVTGPSRIYSAQDTEKILGGGGVTVNIVQHIGQGVQRAEVAMAGRMAKKAAVAEIETRLDRGNRRWDR